MRRYRIFLAALVIYIILTACAQPADTVVPASEAAVDPSNLPDGSSTSAADTTERPFVLYFVPPTIGAFSYENTFINRTKFYDGYQINLRPQYLHPAKEPVSIMTERKNNVTTYYVDGAPYTCVAVVPSDPNEETWPSDDCFTWSYDRRFFYKYAETRLGTLYRDQNIDTLEVMILDAHEGWEYLLMSTESPLVNAQTLSIDDFGLVTFGDTIFARAKDYQIIFEANTREVDNETFFHLEAADEEEAYMGYGVITFECTRIPGLRYHILYNGSDDGQKTYVENRVYKCRVVIYGPTILPVEEWKEQWDARLGYRGPDLALSHSLDEGKED